jgi:membrane fusion protein (multidrug efflux system)
MGLRQGTTATEGIASVISHQDINRKKGHVAAAGLLLAVGLGVLSGCDAKPVAPTGPPPAMPVTVVPVQQADIPLTGQWVSTLDGYVNAQIQPQVSGYLIRQDYREGSVVAKGQVLFEIDPRPFQAAFDQAQGQLDQAKALLGLQQTNVNRDKPLADAHAIAQSQLDTDLAQKAQAAASVQAAQAAVATAQLNLGFTQVRSLISGVAGQATVQVGNLVSPQAVLTSVSQLNPIKAYFSISDSEYLGLVQRSKAGGGDLLNGASKIPLTLTLANGDAHPGKGRIVFVDRQMNAQTGAIRIAAEFPNPGNVLRPGQFGRVSADTEIRHNGLLIPQVAIQELQGLQQVYVAGADGKAHLATVQLGPQIGTNWLVEGGVSAGQLIITDNLMKLRDGAPVTPHQAPAAPVDQASNPVGR